jgi:hypothetical protein
MKRLIQLNLLLLLISTAMAQDSQPQESSPQQPTKTLRVYDWNDLAQQHQLSSGLIISNKFVQQRQLVGEEIISMDGMSVLKIENTNIEPLVISLLKITNSSVVKKTYWVSFDMKINNLERNFFNHYQLAYNIPPSALGGDERTNTSSFEIPAGTSNWKQYELYVNRKEPEGLPTQLEVKLTLGGHGIIYLRPIKLLGVVGSWWSPQQVGLIGGIGGSVIGCFGALLGLLASKGNARTFVLTTMKIFIALGILLTIAGFVAVVSSQPYAVWYALLLPGVILTLVFSLTLPSIQRRYDELEIRRMTSVDTMGS